LSRTGVAAPKPLAVLAIPIFQMWPLARWLAASPYEPSPPRASASSALSAWIYRRPAWAVPTVRTPSSARLCVLCVERLALPPLRVGGAGGSEPSRVHFLAPASPPRSRSPFRRSPRASPWGPSPGGSRLHPTIPFLRAPLRPLRPLRWEVRFTAVPACAMPTPRGDPRPGHSSPPEFRPRNLPLSNPAAAPNFRVENRGAPHITAFDVAGTWRLWRSDIRGWVDERSPPERQKGGDART
jgi:hypothetical protein